MNDAAPPLAPPLAERVDQVDVIHGQRVEDPYRWLEDMGDARSQAWTAAQDAHARAYLATVPSRDAITQRFTELFYVDTISAPARRGDRLFYTRRHKDKEKAIVYWREGEDGAETVLIDPNTLSEDGSTSLGGWYPSHDGSLVAYSLKRNNADEATMYIRDVEAGTDRPDVVAGAKYAYAAWTPDSSGFYYTYLPEGEDIPVADRPGFAEVRFHRLGTDASADAIVFPRLGDPEKFVSPQLSRDGKYLLLYVHHGWNSTDIFFKTLKTPDAITSMPPLAGPVPPLGSPEWRAFNARMLGFKPLVVGVDALFEVDVYKDRFYVLTNEKAARYRVLKVDPKRPAHADWNEIIAEGEATLESVSVIGGHLVVRALKNASGDVEVRTLDGALKHSVNLPSIGGVGSIIGNDDHDTAYFSFSSFTRPPEIYTLSVKSGDTALWARIDLPIDTAAFEIKQVWYPSKDGTKVSMFIVHRREIALDGTHPTLLYGYGGFNNNMGPDYASSVVIWLEMGGVYALPNLRGGGEYGEAWHRAGMKLHKQNVFDDHIAAAEYLIKTGYTSPEKLAIRGGSNGGLLVGAAMTQRPDLFQAVLCGVPLLDMVRYHLFGSGKTWIAEYGSADDTEEFAALYAYSPYHRVKKGVKYPAMLMLAADSDDRVDPMHARKFTALIQWAQGDSDAPVMMRVEKNAGHGGADQVVKMVSYYADQYAFLVDQLAMTWTPPTLGPTK